MSYPRRQYVVAVKEGSRTRYFYGTKLGDMVKQHVKLGREFTYAPLVTGEWSKAYRSSAKSYSTER